MLFGVIPMGSNFMGVGYCPMTHSIANVVDLVGVDFGIVCVDDVDDV